MDVIALLHKNGLSKTRSRLNILQILEETNIPLSGKDICSQLQNKCDKSTVHRTLNSLYNKNILQRIIVDHEVKYALRIDLNGEKKHKGDHLHFKCSKCDAIFCLTDIEIQDYQLPDGFTKEENQFLIIGKCKECH
ncbi:MAG TPA: transcriptional repressor [Bacteroidales bacterium]|nr:transcriptional repressor [Bacteroidales bacterium]